MNATTSSPLGGFEERLLNELRGIVAQRAPRATRTWRLTNPLCSTTTRWTGLTVGAAAAAVAIVVWLPATQTTSAAPPLRIFVSHANAVAARANAERLVRAYPALRPTVAFAAHSAGNVTLGFPSVIAAALTARNGTPLAQFGVDPALATFLSTVGVNAQAWILPAAQGVCLLTLGGDAASPSGGTSCVSATAAASGRFAASETTPASGTWIVGYAPAPNTIVTITESSGPPISAPVTNGVWAISGNAAADAESFSDRDSNGIPQTTQLR